MRRTIGVARALVHVVREVIESERVERERLRSEPRDGRPREHARAPRRAERDGLVRAQAERSDAEVQASDARAS